MAGLESLSRDAKAFLSSSGIQLYLGRIRRVEEDEKSKPVVGNHWGRYSGVVVRTAHAICTRYLFWFKIVALFFVTGAGNEDRDHQVSPSPKVIEEEFRACGSDKIRHWIWVCGCGNYRLHRRTSGLTKHSTFNLPELGLETIITWSYNANYQYAYIFRGPAGSTSRITSSGPREALS